MSDKDDFVWIGTYDGLIRFDGHKFATIALTDSQQLNYGQIVFGVLEDSLNELLIVGTERGVIQYNKKLSRAVQNGYTLLLGKGSLPVKVYREKLYVLIKEKGLCCYDTLQKELEVIDSRIEFKEGDMNDCFTLIDADKTSLWYTINNNVYHYNITTSLLEDSIITNQPINCIASYKGIVYIGSEKKILTYKNNSLTPFNTIYSPTLFAIDRNENVLYYTTKEKKVLYLSLNKFNALSGTSGEIQQLDGLMINKLCTKNNSLLFSIVPGNLGILSLHPFSLNKFPKNTEEEKFFVRSFAAVNDSTILVSTQDKGLFFYNYILRKRCKQRVPIPSQHQAFCLKRLGDTIYISTAKNIYYYSIKSNKFNKIIAFNNDEFISDISFYNYEVYLHKLDATYKIEKGKLVKKNYLNETVNHQQIFIIDSFCFAVNSNNELDIYKNKNGKYFFYKTGPQQINSYFYNYILRLRNSNFAVATSNGLYIVDKNFKQILKWFNQKTGLPNNFIYATLEDKNENLWISSNKGLSVITKTGKIKNFSLDDGIQDYEFNGFACLKTIDETFFFGGVSGFNFFKPITFKFDSTLAKPYLTSILINDDKEISRQPYVKESLLLSYQENTISLSYACIDYHSNGQNHYRYRLEGIDNKWVNNDEKLFVRYSNLSAGKYCFQLKVANSYGIWNEDPLKLYIIIKPPFYQTWWFYLLCSTIICSILYGVYRYRLSQQLKAFKMRQNIANDLHDDIGSTLASISFTSQYLKKQLQSNENQLSEIVGSIYENSRAAMENLSDIVWSINPMNDKFLFIINRFKSIGNVIEQTTDIVFIFTVDEACKQLELNMQARKNIYLIVKEIINNALKHACAKQIDVQIRLQQQLIIEIIDDGIGFDASESNSGNGLKSIRTRVEELNGTLNITSYRGKGVQYHISFPLSQIIV